MLQVGYQGSVASWLLPVSPTSLVDSFQQEGSFCASNSRGCEIIKAHACFCASVHVHDLAKFTFSPLHIPKARPRLKSRSCHLR